MSAQLGLLDFRYPSLTNLNRTVAATEFDINKFNQNFEEAKISKMSVAPLETTETPKSLLDMSITEILIGIKDTWFNIIDDLLQGNFYMDIFTINNRLFFIGLTIVIITIIYYLTITLF